VVPDNQARAVWAKLSESAVPAIRIEHRRWLSSPSHGAAFSLILEISA
jgi:hypothetical protein